MVSRLDRPNPPCVKKERNFKEVLIRNHSQQIFSADFFSRSSQQIFSADFLQQIFSADLLSRVSLSRFSQQIFSADFFSRSSQQIFSADFLQQILSADLLSRFSLSRFSQQIFSADFLSRSSQQIFSADLLIVLSFAVVRGWWSAIVLSFLSFAVVRGWWSAIVLSFAVVRGWWSAIVLSCWWSILHEFFRRTLSRSFREQFLEKIDRVNFDLKRIKGQRLTHTTALGSNERALITTTPSAHAQTKTHNITMPWQSRPKNKRANESAKRAQTTTQFHTFVSCAENVASMYNFFYAHAFQQSMHALRRAFSLHHGSNCPCSSKHNAQLHAVTKLEPRNFHIPYFYLYTLSKHKLFGVVRCGVNRISVVPLYIGSSKNFLVILYFAHMFIAKHPHCILFFSPWLRSPCLVRHGSLGQHPPSSEPILPVCRVYPYVFWLFFCVYHFPSNRKGYLT